MELDAISDALVGAMFTTPKDLRHLVEGATGSLFVPVEVLSSGPLQARIRVSPAGLGELVVQAVRERHWHPYRITRVEPAGAAQPRDPRELAHPRR